MPTQNTLDWEAAGANGDYTIGSGDTAMGVTIETPTNSAGQTGVVTPHGDPLVTGLWVASATEPVTTTITFDGPVENVSFELFDIDELGGSWDDRVTILATDVDGNLVPISVSDLDGLHSVSGNTIDADGMESFTVQSTGGAESVTVDIAGPIVALEIIFENGEDASTATHMGLGDITFTNAPDGIVEGDDTDNVIDYTYVDDPEGDMVGTTDDSILGEGGNDVIDGGAGNDTISGGTGADSIVGGLGDDLIYGDEGADSVEMSAGNDTFHGGEGDDYVNGDLGNDVLYGGTGDDFLRGSYGNDTIYSGTTGEGDDFLWGGYGDDRFIIENDFGNDTIAGEDQAETDGDTLDLTGVTSDLTIDLSNAISGKGTFSDGTSTTEYEAIEHIELGAGVDTLVLADGSGSDTVTGFAAPTDNGDGSFTGLDQLDVTALTRDYGSNQVTTRDVTVTSNGDGDAVLSFPGGESLTLVGVSASAFDNPLALEAIGIPEAPDGYVTGTSGDDVMTAGYMDADGDYIDGDDAALPGSSGDDDHVLAEGGNDMVFAGVGDDSVEGGTGNDSLFGSVGADTLSGDAGNDEIYGEDGDDYLRGGAGADLLDGGADSDYFSDVGDGDTIVGGETGTDFDTLDLTGMGPLNILADKGDPESGTVEFLDTDGNVTGSLTYEGIEKIVPCFTPGTRIATADGMKNAEDIKVGDLVMTRDHGLQAVRWAGAKTLDAGDLEASRYLRPIRLQKGALGDNLPENDILVSPNHRILIADARTELLFGDVEILVAAKHLLNLKGVSRVDAGDVTYIHFMFDRHEIVWSDGLWSESFQPGAQAIAGLSDGQRAEIFTLFPELKCESGEAFKTARRILRRHEAKLLTPQSE
jgi:Ca2+-binding RTX toxin-like protein